jgi:N-acetylneuraminate synthase
MVINKIRAPYIIAEIGVNHENNLKQAVKMIRAAKKSGADAVKFQSYKAHKLASSNSPAYWDTTKEPTESQYKLFKKYDQFSKKEYGYLANVCLDSNIEFLSTPFDFEAVDYLDNLMSIFKVASADITNVQLLEHIAEKKKPVIISTGASTIGEISDAVSLFSNEGIEDITILHCVLQIIIMQIYK